MDFDAVEWDDANLDHATRHGVSAVEVEQVIQNATEFRRSKHHPDRRRIQARTDGGRRVVVIIQVLAGGRARPITAWEDE